MITAVDSSVVLDVLGADPRFGEKSRAALRRSIAEGSLVACEVVWAEVVAAFPSEAESSRALAQLGVRFSGIDARAAAAAGTTFRTYRRSGGRRERLIADFLIGAHAEIQADRLLTRDRGFYRSYFSRLAIIDPARP